jgi:alpha-glucosidase
MAPLIQRLVYASLSVGFLSNASPLQSRSARKDLSDCPGYSASNVKYIHNGLTADLKLAGDACNVYGTDIEDLTLTVEYQAGTRCISNP